ncbi:SEN1 N terminal-domain-containing protein [Dichomitus squalens]|uniref:SEN1 N terminal-domain-containing protein n=1 Tax=Dichomitus squalens TaxID=114155 RepID=A0A4Q9Q4R7_9APHY|nr:SEN1 N terminal-domain-containing protein [Dichomitus squalens]
MATQPPPKNEVKKKLVELRDAPVAMVPDEVLRILSMYLLGSLSAPANPTTFISAHEHWFCSQADEVTREAATFLIRLHAYNSNSVDVWRLHLKRVLSRCCYCVRGLHEAEIMSRHTYFGAFNDNVLKTFYGSFHNFLTDFVVQALAEKDFTGGTAQGPDSERTFVDAPPAITFLMATYLHMLEDSRIVGLLHKYCPRAPIKSWPSDIPPSGLLALLFDGPHDIRVWGQKQCISCEVAPIPMENFSPSHITVLKAVCESITSSRTLSDCLGDTYKVPWLQDLPAIWAGFTLFLRFVPVELFRASRTFDIDIRHMIVGHLHDTETHFIDVLKSFIIILRRMGPDAWQGEGPEYAHVVFNSIKDNTRFADILCNLPAPVAKDDWQLKWLEVYANSVGKLPVFKDILPTVLQFLCEQLQHVRYKVVRPVAMSIASRLLYAVLAHQGKDGSARQDLALDLLTVHSAVYVSVAFGKTHADEAWEDARKQARRLIKQALLTDVRRAAAAITSLCSPSSGTTPLPASLIHERVWANIYDSVEPKDSDAIVTLASVVAHVAHIDELKPAAFEDIFKKSQSSSSSRATLSAVNSALVVFRSGFRDVVVRYTDLSRASTAVDLLGQDDVVKDVVSIMFSPVEALQEAAQALVALAYDVDGRLDCFRALLEHYPAAALAGVCEYLTTYTRYATVVPEACSLSQALARCLTDIIEGLCSSPDGLLLQPKFLKAAGNVLEEQIPKLWHLMTEALCVIFAHTPRWARFFENEEMVIWMRDALIFGRDLLAQRRTLESGALVRSQKDVGANKRLSAVGKAMVDDLQQVLYELTKWLRLTDEELLHQSFALLETLLEGFRSTNTRPRDETFQRIQRHIDDARKNDPNRMRSRLDSTRLLRLQEAIGAFDEDDDDDIQIISHTFGPMPNKVKKEGKAKAEPRHILKSSGDLKGKGSERKDRPTISSYFSSGDVKRAEAKPVVPSTSTRPAPIHRPSKPTIKDESAKSSTAASSTLPSSSSEEESDEDEDDDGPKGLAGLSKLQKTPAIKKPVERRQVKMLDLPLDGKNPRLEMIRKREDARRTHMRLKPDVSGLYRTLLSWNYEHNGPMPPGEKPRLSSVPDRFGDYAHFRSVYEPMLFLELWNQLVESKEQPLESHDCRILSRQYTDEYIDLEVSIEGSVGKEWSLAETDIVLLSSSNAKRRVLGKAQSYRASYMGIQATIRYLASGGDPGLQVGTSWSLAKVLSLSTIIREYGALMALPHYDLLDSILRTQLPKPNKVDSGEVQRVMKAYNVNEPQANAILKSLDTEGFALIQGPPGTGKTSTICGLVQLYLSRRSKTIGRPGDKEIPKKILLCAPSNAAIDEIAFRLKEGVSGAGHRAEHPKVVRIGAPKAMNLSVRDVSLEYLMDQKLNAHPELQNTKEAGTELARVRAELESVKVQRQQKMDEMALTHDNAAKTLALEDDIKKLNRAKAMLTHQLDKVKDKQKSDYRTLDATRRRFRNEVLQEADVICSTLSASAYEYLESFDFEVVIIDEAAQAIELSSLIPMKYRCRTCIMVGDPQQLPPTVKSQEACRLGYDQSLFVRLQKSQPDAVHLLSIQYRMHPDISQLPSNLFYDGRLSDGPEMAAKTKRPWHNHPKFGTYRFFSVESGTEENMPGTGHSLVNRSEAQVAVALYNRLIKEFSSTDFDFKVGVISMYRGQIVELKRAFRQRFGEEVLSTVDFNTVDGFQGQEKDIIILSCVRSGPSLQTVGFLRDVRRMNVALTRAKASLFVLGNAPTLERSDDIWRKIVDNARSRTSLIKADVAYFTAPNTYTAPLPQPTKPKPKPASKTIVGPPPPPDLATPRELKAIANRSNAPAPAATQPPAPDAPKEAPFAPDVPVTVASEEAQVGQKRRAEGPPKDDAGGSGAAQGNSKPKPKPPAAKRQKQGPSLFIPKKR